MMEWTLVALIWVLSLSIPAMVISFYLRCPHCGSWRGSYTPPPREPDLDGELREMLDAR